MENIAFPFNIKKGEIESADYTASINQSVKIILLTHKGERIMQPKFGTNLRMYLFEPLNQTIREIIKTEVINSLYEWENRIKDIEVEFNDAENNDSLCVTVCYNIAGLDVKDSVQITINN